MKILKDNTRLLNRSIYLLIFLFLTPTVYSIYIQHLVNFRIVSYFSAALLLFVVFKCRDFLFNTSINIPKKTINIFFATCLIMLIYSMYAQFYSFSVDGSDFSIFENMLQQMLKGNFGYSDYVGFYHFSTHQNYILVLLLPFYSIFKSSLFLEILSGIFIWIAGIVLFVIARRETKNDFFAVILVLAFYLCPGINNAIQTNFRPELLYPLIFLCLYYSYRYSSNLVYSITLLIFLLIREEVPIYLLGFIYLSIKDKNYIKLLNTIILSGIILFINMTIIQPYFTAKSHLVIPTTLHFWSEWGNSKHEILSNVLTHPLQVLQRIFDKDSGIWNVYLFVLFIPLLDMFVFLSSIPILIIHCSANSFNIHHLDLYYAVLLTTLIFIGLIRIKNRYNKNLYISGFLIVLIIIYPIMGAGWLELKAIDRQQIKDWQKLNNLLHTQYNNSSLCLYKSIYPYFSAYDFNILGNDSFNHSNSCIRIFTATDWDKIKDNSYVVKDSCKRIGKFVYCIK